MSQECIIWAVIMYASGACFFVSYLCLLWHALLALEDDSSRLPASQWAVATFVFAFTGIGSLAQVYYIIPCASN